MKNEESNAESNTRTNSCSNAVNKGCSTGKFANNTSIAEALLWKSGGGAVGTIAPSYLTWGCYNELLLQGAIDSLWPDYDGAHSNDELRKMGKVLNFMKVYLNTYVSTDSTIYHAYAYHLFGDPALEFRSGFPLEKSAFQVVTRKDPMRPREIIVRGAPDGALVALSQRDPMGNMTLLGRALSQRREALITLANKIDWTLGTLHLTVTHHTMVPYMARLTGSAAYSLAVE